MVHLVISWAPILDIMSMDHYYVVWYWILRVYSYYYSMWPVVYERILMVPWRMMLSYVKLDLLLVVCIMVIDWYYYCWQWWWLMDSYLKSNDGYTISYIFHRRLWNRLQSVYRYFCNGQRLYEQRWCIPSACAPQNTRRKQELTLGIAANNVGLTPVNNAARPSLRYIDAIVLNTPRLICCCGSINLSIPDELDILDAAVLVEVVVIACSRILTTSNGLNARTYIIDPTDPERMRDVGVLIVTSVMLVWWDVWSRPGLIRYLPFKFLAESCFRDRMTAGAMCTNSMWLQIINDNILKNLLL